MNQLSLNINCQLDSFSLTIKQILPLTGITGIYGRSGSGKSTLLRIIAGLNHQATGQIIFGQTTLLSTDNQHFIKAEQRQIAMVFQGAMNSLDPVFTIKQQFTEILKDHSKRNLIRRK